MEVEVNTTRSSLLQDDKVNGGKAVVQRQAINDSRGEVAELLAKCISPGSLDQTLTKEDRDRVLTFLEDLRPARFNEKICRVRPCRLFDPSRAPAANETRGTQQADLICAHAAGRRFLGKGCSLKRPSICRRPCTSARAATTASRMPSTKNSAMSSSTARP